ncbi:MAG TPA: WG repeat-containing protein [Chryseolinea sp.]
MVRIIFVCTVVLLSVPVHGQVSSERLALNNIEKRKWDKAFGQLSKALSKDSLNVAASYVMGCYFFAPDNPEFQLDSAYRYVQKAARDFELSSLKQRERWKRFPLDSIGIVDLRVKIDSAAFERAKQFDTENSYIDFINGFPTAAEQTLALSLRNKAAYRLAQAENNHHAFNNFISKYPDSEQIAEARARYHELLFQDITRDKRLASYKLYLREYPGTLYAVEAERNILEISTADGTIESYLAFIKEYPSGTSTRRANSILFHLVSDDQKRELYPHEQNSDSLNAIVELMRGYLVPFLHDGRFGFMNQQGIEVINPETEELDKHYRCGNLTDDVIRLPHKLVAINGATIYDHAVENVEDLGHGFLTIETDTCTFVLHKTGFTVGEKCIQSAKVVNGKFLALQKNSLWSLWTLTGRLLLPFGWEDIQVIKDVIILKAKNKYTITTEEEVAALADQNELGLTEFADEVKGWRGDFIWVKSGATEGILNQNMDTVVQVRDHVLSPAYFGFIAKRNNVFQTWNDAGDTSRHFRQVVSMEPWTAVRTDSSWHLFDAKTNSFQSSHYDSVFFVGPTAVGIRSDSTTIHFSTKTSITVAQPARVDFIPGQESFLLLEQGAKKNLFDLDGKKLAVLNYDNVQFAGQGFFVVSKKEKKGLINSAGKLVLPIEYDAIGTASKGTVSLLKGTKFGLFDCKTRKLIKPQYSKNLTFYNNNHLIAYKDGTVGLIGWDNKPLSKLQFNEIRFWNDTTAIVRKDGRWMLYAIKEQKVIADKISNLNFITDGEEKLAIVEQERKFGVIHNKRGTIIPINFSDILNVGSPDVPLYFTEKHVEEASIFVVIYYDSKGNMLRKEVYEQDDYEKIYCSNN